MPRILSVVSLLFFFVIHAPSALGQWQQTGNKIYYTSGPVGIGTSTPTSQARLHVLATGTKVLRLSRDQVGTWDLGITSADRFALYEDGVSTARFVVSNSGDFGIGTESPARRFHVFDTEEQLISLSHSGVGSWHVGVDDNDGFAIWEDGVSDPRIAIQNSGELLVGGTVKAEEIIVTTNVFPDYVFAKDYFLMPLDELRSFIEENGRLPGMPSASDVVQNGLQMGDMQVRLVEKIEELTLHTIAQQEQIEALKQIVEDQQALISQIVLQRK